MLPDHMGGVGGEREEGEGVTMHPTPRGTLWSEPTPLARKTDPATSHKAAAGAARFAGGHRARVLADIKANPGSTASEIGDRIGLTNVQVCRRLPELVSSGEIRKGDDRASRLTGSDETTYYAEDQR